MTQAPPAEPAEESAATCSLGARYWVGWSAGLALIVTLFFGGMLASVLATPANWRWMTTAAVTIVGTLALVYHSLGPMRAMQARGQGEPMRPAFRRYLRRFMIGMFSYVVVLQAATSIWNAYQPTGLLAWLLALAPAAPVFFAVRAIVLLLREEDDEFLREGLFRSITWALMGTLAVCTAWGFLDTFELVPHTPLWAVFPIWACCLAPAQIIYWRKYR